MYFTVKIKYIIFRLPKLTVIIRMMMTNEAQVKKKKYEMLRDLNATL